MTQAQSLEKSSFYDLSNFEYDEIENLRSMVYFLKKIGRKSGFKPSADSMSSVRRRNLKSDSSINNWDEEAEIYLSDYKAKYETQADSLKMLSSPEETMVQSSSVENNDMMERASVPYREINQSGEGNAPTIKFRTQHFCPDPTAANLPCPTEDIDRKCDKYNGGDFLECYFECKISFCCIHDSKSQTYSPSCSDEPNCPAYNPCYIIWWKLHDTIGPANFLRLPQSENFFQGADFQFILDELNDPNDTVFFQQLFGHHFDSEEEPVDDQIQDPSNW
eukprot:CAMPEP_0184861752 /NCGR_PEP_ID=MMETSP0580-20130426/6361_1 /TAXON_ID=1118495 /ORGANISM="Dactyliosolen fragilissimus" /LENGTH=276 /DNA_ID=CAMNT_0027359349 /DNA_START=157 /DNA_END=987 /DNA_ORIENTATION=-